MSLLAALTRKSDPLEGRALDSSILQAWGRGDDVGALPANVAGITVSRDSALGLSAVWACVSLIADSIATLPKDLYSTDANGVRTPAARPDWLDAPNPEQTGIDFTFGQVVSMLLEGNAYVYTVRDRVGDVVEAWPLDPNFVRVQREFDPKRPGQTRLVYYVMVAKGLQSPVGPFRVPAGPDMFHIPAFQVGANDPRGVSPIERLRLMFGGALGGQEMGARFFGQGMNAGGVIEVPEQLEIEQARELKEDFARANGGLRKMHLPPVLTGGATFKQISISPEQAQFLQQREFSVEEVARLFRVPPYMVGAMTKTTTWGSGIEQQGIGFVTYTLRPWIERLEESWSRHMLMTRPELKVGFNVEGLLRGDLETRYRAYGIARQWGFMSANDVLLAEGKQPIGDQGDIYLTPVNMASPKGFPAAEPIPTAVGDPQDPTIDAGEA